MATAKKLTGDFAFKLYDTYGFPLDLTELMAREQGLTVDTAGFEKLMEEQRTMARSAQKREIISVSNVQTTVPTRFVGYDQMEADATVQEIVKIKDKTAVVLDVSACYAEMGGQVGDMGKLSGQGHEWHIANTQKAAATFLHILDKNATDGASLPEVGSPVKLVVDAARRAAIQRHHTVTHLLHWALHEVVSREASQKGSFVGPDKLTFDFNGSALTPGQVADVERLVNERIVENAPVMWMDVPFEEIKGRPEVMQFFGEKYGDVVRVIQIGGKAGQFNGYSMELCGGTHTHATGEIGLFRIAAESAIAAGVRRIEAMAGLCAYEKARHDAGLLLTLAGKINSPVAEVEKKIETLLAQQKELEHQLKTVKMKQAGEMARSLQAQAKTYGSVKAIIQAIADADGDFLQSVVETLKSEFKGVVVLASVNGSTVALAAGVSHELTKQIQAGKIIQAIAPILGGKGGGKPDFARGAGKEANKVAEALAKAESLMPA